MCLIAANKDVFRFYFLYHCIKHFKKDNYMKKVWLLAIGLYACSVAAQPAFTSGNCFAVGDSSKLGFAVYTQPFDNFVTATGTAYTWDFSNAAWAAPTVPYVFQPGSESIHTLFAGSTINEYAAVMFPRDLFFTYNSPKDTLYYDGLYTSVNSKYNPAVPYFSFPLNFNDSGTTWKQQFANPNQPANATGSVSRMWVYDGYGTLKLPYGTVQKVMRLRTRQTDSVYVLKGGVTAEELIWFDETTGIPVLRFVKNATVISAYYASASATAAVDNTVITGVKVYPGVADDYITVSGLSGSAVYTISNAAGVVCIKGRLHTHANSIHVQSLPAGMYYFTDDSGHRARFFIVR